MEYCSKIYVRNDHRLGFHPQAQKLEQYEKNKVLSLGRRYK